jgi:hypothetical protein
VARPLGWGTNRFKKSNPHSSQKTKKLNLTKKIFPDFSRESGKRK